MVNPPACKLELPTFLVKQSAECIGATAIQLFDNGPPVGYKGAALIPWALVFRKEAGDMIKMFFGTHHARSLLAAPVPQT